MFSASPPSSLSEENASTLRIEKNLPRSIGKSKKTVSPVSTNNLVNKSVTSGENNICSPLKFSNEDLSDDFEPNSDKDKIIFTSSNKPINENKEDTISIRPKTSSDTTKSLIQGSIINLDERTNIFRRTCGLNSVTIPQKRNTIFLPAGVRYTPTSSNNLCVLPELKKSPIKERKTTIVNGNLQAPQKKESNSKHNDANKINNVESHFMVNHNNGIGDGEENCEPSGRCKCTSNCDEWANCVRWKSINLDYGIQRHKNLTKSFLKYSEVNMELPKIVTSTSLLQGPLIPQPATTPEIYINKELRYQIRTQEIKEDINYIWPAIMRRLNLIVVTKNEEHSLYLPPICSIGLEIEKYYADVMMFEGPLIIVIEKDDIGCEKIHNYMQEFYKNLWEMPIIRMINSETTDVITCDILVTTLRKLEKYLKLSKLKLQKLCHLVMVNADFQLNTYPQTVSKLFQIVNELVIRRTSSKTIQLIAIAKNWTLDLETLSQKLEMTPLIYLQDYLEAAIYSKCEFKRKICDKLFTFCQARDILCNSYRNHKTLLFCRDEEISKIRNHFNIEGVDCIAISNDLNEDDLLDNENLFVSLGVGCGKVLICSDNSFKRLKKIKNTERIVHVGIPLNWNELVERFRCMLETFGTMSDYEKKPCYSFFLLEDENGSEIQMLDTFFSFTTQRAKHLNLNVISKYNTTI